MAKLGAVNNHCFVVVCDLNALVACIISIKWLVSSIRSPSRADGSLATQLYRSVGAANPDNQPDWTSLHNTAVRLDSKPFLSSAAIAGEMSTLQGVLASLETSIYHVQVTRYLSGVFRALTAV